MAGSLEHDILRPLRIDEIEQMVEVCALNLPISVRGYNFLRTILKLSKRFDDNPAECEKLVVSNYLRRKIYTKRDGNLENCTFISVSHSDIDYNVYVYSNDVYELRECLMKTNLIDYSIGPFFISFEGRYRNILGDMFEVRKIEIDSEIITTGWFLSKANAIKLEYENEIPDDVVVETLRTDDANVVNEVWEYRYPGSIEYINSLIELNDTIGVFSKDSRELRSWVLVNGQFGLGMVQTTLAHRGKGYAKIVIKALSKLLATKYDLDVLAFIAQGNTVSEHTFTRLGFIEIPMENHYSWMLMKKKECTFK